MSWTIFHGRGRLLSAGVRDPNAHGSFIERRATEEEALDYACELLQRGHGIHSVGEFGKEPKYRQNDIIRLANERLSTPRSLRK